jgi:hypothetical protein
MRTPPSLPFLLFVSLCIAAAAADPQKSYTADSKLTDQLPDRSSKGEGPQVANQAWRHLYQEL